MTFTEIQTEVMAETGATASTAQTRIGRFINRVYRRVTAGIGMQLSRRTLAASAAVSAAAQTVTFTGAEKVVRVWYLDSDSRKIFLDLVSHEELRDRTPETSDTPARYAVSTVAGTSVTLLLDTVADDGYTLYADIYATVSTLSGSSVPAFSESFHEILVYGALELEWKGLHKEDKAKEARMQYERLFSDLKYWYMKSAYLDMRQGSRKIVPPGHLR